VRQVERPARDRQRPRAQQRGVLLGQSHGDFARELRVPPQLEGFPFAAPMEIRPVRSDQLEPGLIQKLPGAGRAGALVPGIRTAVRFDLDDALDQGGDGRLAGPVMGNQVDQ